jgi:UDP-glucose 4-epimerase
MKKVVVTGSSGFLGKKVVLNLLKNNFHVLGVDLKNSNIIHPHFEESINDIREFSINESIHTIIHLASVMNPPKSMSDGEIESIEIDGLLNLLNIFKKNAGEKFIFTSSGAAYGYTERNLTPLNETDKTLGSIYFPYSKHKAQSEHIITKELSTNQYTIFRPGTILGDGMRGPIFDYFKKKMVIGVRKYDSPFCFIHTSDVVTAITHATQKENLYGTFNLAGDGALKLKDCCKILQTKHFAIPRYALKTGIHLLKKFKMTQYHPYQVDFMCFRPVLNNEKLKKNFPGLPSKSSEEVFREFCQEELTIKE